MTPHDMIAWPTAVLVAYTMGVFTANDNEPVLTPDPRPALWAIGETIGGE